MNGAGSATELPAAGWYADPQVPGQLRWWGGTAWTSSTRPAAAPERGGLPPTQTEQWVRAARWLPKSLLPILAPLLVSAEPVTAAEPGEVPLTQTEQWVKNATQSGVVLARRTFLPRALVRIVAPLLVSAAILWLLSIMTVDAGLADVWNALAAAIVIGSLGSAAFELERTRRTHAVLRDLPVDGSIGPGEVQARMYAATWRVDQLRGMVALAATVLGVAYVVRVASVGGLFDHADPGGVRLALAVGVSAVAIVGVTEVRQWRTSSAVARGQLTPASTASPHRPSPARGQNSDAPAPVVWSTVRGSGQIRCWSAPVMRVYVPGTLPQMAGWSFAGSVHHDRWAQNTVVVTDEAVYLLCAIPSTQAAVLADESYGQVKMALFYSGSEIREEATRLLSSGIGAAMASDPRNIRIPRDSLAAVECAQGSCALTFVPTTGMRQGYIFNHADTAAAFLHEAAATWLPLRSPTAGSTWHMPDLSWLAPAGRVVLRVVAGLAALVAALLVVIVGLGFVGALSQITLTGRATGTVISVTPFTDPSPVKTMAPSVRCEVHAQFTVAGRSYRTDDQTLSMDHCLLAVGQSTVVAFREADPTRSTVGAPTVLGVVVTGIGVLLGLGLFVGAGAVALRPERLYGARARRSR